MIPALVLTAGLATRLRPLSLVRAKAALPVAGVPLAVRILSQLRAAGVTDAVLNLHHRPDTITREIGDGEALGLRVRYSWETPVLGSAGGPRRAAPILGASPFLIVNGDTLTSVDLAALVDDHRRHGALVTMAVVPNREPRKYSGVAADDDGAFTGVVARGASQPSFHFIGVQVADASAFDSVPAGVPFESVANLYPALVAARRGAVRVCLGEWEFHDIGTPLDYLETSRRLAAHDEACLTGRGASIAPDATVERSILWDDVTVGAGATLRDCIVTDGATIPDGASWERAIIRVAQGDLFQGERRVGSLAVSPLG